MTIDKEAPALPKCPFCGWAPDTHHNADEANIYCPNENCGLAQVHVSLETDEDPWPVAIALWSKRHSATYGDVPADEAIPQDVFELANAVRNRAVWNSNEAVMIVARAIMLDRTARTPSGRAGEGWGPTITWSEPAPPNDECRYDYVFGVFGPLKFSIEWKGWKDYPAYGATVTMEENWVAVDDDLDRAKQSIEKWVVAQFAPNPPVSDKKEG